MIKLRNLSVLTLLVVAACGDAADLVRLLLLSRPIRLETR